MEFIYYYKLQSEKNKILISCNSSQLITQVKEVGCHLNLEYYTLFSPKSKLVKPQWYNRMPLKLIRLFVSKIRLQKIVEKNNVDRLILGNYSNFISQYSTQICKSNTFVLDDGTGSITIANKRIDEIKNRIPIFDHNYKKGALWMVKILMGFYQYKIPLKFTFFSSYKFEVVGKDQLVINSFSFLKSLYNHQSINLEKECFIGSPISEVGYISLEKEIELILGYANKMHRSKLIYIPHRLDSDLKIKRLRKSLDVLRFNLPIEYALAQSSDLPSKIGGFFTSALPNLIEIIDNDLKYFSLKIPSQLYLTKIMEDRVVEIYKTFEAMNEIELIEGDREA